MESLRELNKINNRVHNFQIEGQSQRDLNKIHNRVDNFQLELFKMD